MDLPELGDVLVDGIVELEAAGVTEDELKALEKEVRQIVQEAADFAENSPEPPPAELYTDVLVERY